MRKPNRIPSVRAAALAAGGAAALAGSLVAAAPALAGGAHEPRPVLARRAGAAAPSREDTARALHLLSRATFGVRPEDLAALLRVGPNAWLDAQLHPERLDDAALQPRLADYPAAAMSPRELVVAYPKPKAVPVRAARDSARLAAAGAQGMSADADAAGANGAAQPARPRRRAPVPGDTAAAMRADAAGFARPGRAGRPQGPGAILVDLGGAKLERAAASQRQLQEVMTDFWFNHFNVYFGKGQDRYLIGAYEREAIRPYVFGRFRDMLRATARHPAMLVYLDNAQSVAADSMRKYAPAMAPGARVRPGFGLGGGFGAGGRMRRGAGASIVFGGGRPAAAARGDTAAARRRADRGLNENYARELMELHTLGVHGGYTQHDVAEVARAFTGWSVSRDPGVVLRAGQEPEFVFRPALHDYGPKTILGRSFPAGHGEDEGDQVLDLLARSPATARHLCYELAQRFVADDPPQSLVDRLTGVWTGTDGDLRAVTRALFTSPEFNDARYRGTKVKTPLEFVTSAMRVTGTDASPPSRLLGVLRQMGELPYFASPPTGYPNTSVDWTSGGAMLARMNMALALASGRWDGPKIDPARFADAMRESGTQVQVAALARQVLPGVNDPALIRTIVEDVDAQPRLTPELKMQRELGLLLGSPDFQRR